VTASNILGKVAWVTGASSGIGEALVQALAARGASVVLSSRRNDLLLKVQAACSHADQHLALPLDLLNQVEFEPAVRMVLDRFGRIDTLVHCAGISQRAQAVETQLHVDRHIMELNYFGPIGLTKQVLPSMIERRSGHIVVVSSLLGKFAARGRSAYCASKHALHGFFDSLRAEIYPHGIAVTMACPGFVRTNASLNALRGDGQPHGKMDDLTARGLESQACAQRLIKAIEQRRREVYIGRNETLALYLSRWAPNLFHRFIRNTTLK
jgi:short-subunit dehydrogenase